MTTTKKLWLGFGTLIAMLVLIVVPVWIWLNSLSDEVIQITTVAGPMNEAVHELEINVNSIGLAVSNYLHVHEPAQRKRFERDVADFRRYKVSYDQLSANLRQAEHRTELDAFFTEYSALGREVMDQHDAGQVKVADLRRFIDLRGQLDDLLDDEIQKQTLTDLLTRRENVQTAFRSILVTLGIMLTLGLLIAIVSSVVIGRGVVKGEETLRITLTSIGDAVITTDDRGRVVYQNPVAESLTGWPTAEAEGRPLVEVFNIVNEKSRETVENPVDKVLRVGQIVGLANHTILIARDGSERSIDDSAAPIRDAQGKIIGVVLIFRDISDRRRSEREIREITERKSAVLSAALDGIITIDHQGLVVEFNPAAEAMFGYSQDDAIGREMAEMIIPPEYRDRHREGIARYLQTGEGPVLNRHIEITAQRADGSEFPVELAITRINQNDPPLFTGYIRDISERRRVEAELLESERRRQLALEASEFGEWHVETATNELTTDERFRLIFNGSTEPITYEQAFAAIHPDDRQRIDEAVGAATRPDDPAPYAEEYRVVHPDGKVVWVFAKGRANFANTPAGMKLVSFDGTILDITAHKQTQESLREHERRFRTLVEQVADYAIFVTDTEGLATTWNEGVLAVLGFSEEEFIGTDIVPTIFTPEDVASGVAQAELNRAAAEGSASDDRWMRRKDGTRFWAAGVTTGLHDDNGKLLGFMKVMRDQTERKNMEDELREFAARLSEADRRKTEFLATLGHELRNPLAPIRTGLEAMKLAKDDPATIEEVRNMMERQVQQMVRLIDDLLDVSRITRGKIELRTCRVSLEEILNSAVEATRPFIDEADHELKVSLPDSPVFLDADPNRLAQVFANLLINSAKYTPDGGHIHLEAQLEKEDQVVVTVKDDGLGIPADMLDGIFEMFTQIERPAEKGYSGLGIGLTLVRRLVDMHGGSIEVESEGADKGSQFRVRLPMLTDVTASELPTVDEIPQSQSLRVLVVDDNRAAATMLNLVVKMLGNEVQTAHDGREAIGVAAAFLPHVVLMDLGMPNMNGYEAARHIRDQPWGEKMLLVALTGWGQDEDREKTREAGFDHHLVKPAEPAALQQLLANHQPRY